MTEVEPEYDTIERDGWYELRDYEEALCPQCGRLMSECGDPDTDWYPQRHICWATAARQVATRRWSALIEQAKPDEAGFLPTDGVQVWVSPDDLTPDDDFLEDGLPDGD